MHELALPKTDKNPFLNQTQVLVYGTNIDTELKAQIVKNQLKQVVGITHLSVDIENWERVLRIECSIVTDPEMVLIKVKSMGFRCYEL
ncbi:hypothetical protein [Aequorivita sp. Q41]|uniref:hypothetical protein n=1 Tax=Aequorivita sp. Q41 TaxID=3153300 RepID=UPI0032421C43